MIETRQIPWIPSPHGGPLGRNKEHDERSRDFPVTARMTPATRRAVLHKRHGSILDQGQIGSCTGNALEAGLGCEPLHHFLERHTEKKAVALYKLATTLDEFPGAFPPDDTGSSGLSVCKAAVKVGRLTRYEHAFTLDQALDALQLGPIITGIDWYEGFDRPGVNGLLRISGQIRGGHELVLRGWSPGPEGGLLYGDNSWSASWGDHGHFTMQVSTWARLLDAEGDATVPLRG